MKNTMMDINMQSSTYYDDSIAKIKRLLNDMDDEINIRPYIQEVMFHIQYFYGSKYPLDLLENVAMMLFSLDARNWQLMSIKIFIQSVLDGWDKISKYEQGV
jgi:hypothetical protein